MDFKIGDRVRLKIDRTGVVWNDDNTGTGKALKYTAHQAKAGEEGKVTGQFSVLMDNGIEIGCYGNDFVDPDEQFEERFEKILIDP